MTTEQSDKLKEQRRKAYKKYWAKKKYEREEREALKLIAKLKIDDDSRCIYCNIPINKKTGIGDMSSDGPVLSCTSCFNFKKERGFSFDEMRIVGGLIDEILASRRSNVIPFQRSYN